MLLTNLCLKMNNWSAKLRSSGGSIFTNTMPFFYLLRRQYILKSMNRSPKCRNTDQESDQEFAHKCLFTHAKAGKYLTQIISHTLKIRGRDVDIESLLTQRATRSVEFLNNTILKIYQCQHCTYLPTDGVSFWMSVFPPNINIFKKGNWPNNKKYIVENLNKICF